MTTRELLCDGLHGAGVASDDLCAALGCRCGKVFTRTLAPHQSRTGRNGLFRSRWPHPGVRCSFNLLPHDRGLVSDFTMADTDLPLVHPLMRTDVIGYLACNSVLGFISLVILALRVWGHLIGIGLGPDDWLILAAEASCSLASHISPFSLHSNPLTLLASRALWCHFPGNT